MSERVATQILLDPEHADRGELENLLAAPIEVERNETSSARIDGALIGTLVALNEDGTVPLVIYQGQRESAALPARATLDLHGQHIGRGIVLVFEEGDPRRPIVVGCLHDSHQRALPVVPGRVEVDVDGQRMVVSAKEQLVLRCGKASITLTHAGKVLIEGTYVSNRSSGVLRVKGGSVQIN